MGKGPIYKTTDIPLGRLRQRDSEIETDRQTEGHKDRQSSGVVEG